MSNINIPGAKPARSISLDELAQMTSETQAAERRNVVLGRDGKPLQEVKTVDLTVRDNYNPLEGSIQSKAMNFSKIDTTSTIDVPLTMDAPVTTKYIPPELRENLKPAAIEDIAPPAETKKVETLQEKWTRDLDHAIERDKHAQWNDVIMPLYEKELEKKALKELGIDSEDDDNTEQSYESDSVVPKDDSYKIEEEDFDIMDDDMTTDNTVSQDDYDFNAVQEAYEEPVQPLPVVNDGIPTMPQPPVQQAVVKQPVTSEPEVIPEITIKPPTGNINDIDLDNIFGEDTSSELEQSDDSDIDEVELSEEDQKDEITAMQKVIRQEIKPINKVIDISKFKVASKPINSSRVLANMTTSRSVHTANWYLSNAGRPFTMSELGGSEIEKLNPSAETGLSEIMRNRERYGIFYDHIVDNNKPASFEAWAKIVPYDDVKALYYGAYRASFSHGSNLLPYYCDNLRCKHSFMHHKPIDEMVRFSDDAAKERAKTVMSMDPTGLNMSLESRIFQVSDDICISFHTPSIYNVEFEIPVLPKKFRDKYEELMYYISCIEDIYQIDHNNGFLVKMATKIEPDNIGKTVANKYKAYAAILQRLSPDQYYSIYSYIKEVKEDHSSELIFEYPEVTCPKCGKVIKAVEMDPMQMLFTRLRLPTILVL